MSYDYERYDGERVVVDGEIIGLLAMEFGHEVEEVWEEYHAELAMTEEQERQSESYKESLRRTLSAQYEKVATLETENAKLRELVSELYQQVLHDDAAWRDVRAWEDGLPSDCLHPIRSYDSSLGKHTAAPQFEKRMRELGVEVE